MMKRNLWKKMITSEIESLNSQEMPMKLSEDKSQLLIVWPSHTEIMLKKVTINKCSE